MDENNSNVNATNGANGASNKKPLTKEQKEKLWHRKQQEQQKKTIIVVIIIVVVLVVAGIIWWAMSSNNRKANSVPAPTGLTASTSNSTITLNWNAVAGASKYNVYISNSSGVCQTNFSAKVPVNTNTASINLPAGTYYFAVSALKVCKGQENESGLSNEVSASTPTCPGSNLSTPSLLDAEAIGGGQVEIEWPGVLDAASYNVYRAQGRPVSTSDYDQLFNSEATELLFTGLASGSTQSFIVTAVDACGNETAPSPQVQVTVDCNTPPTPEITNATSASGSISVSWAALDNTTGYVAYLQQGSSVGPSNYIIRQPVASNVLAFTFNGLSPATTYAIGISATNACGESALNVVAVNTSGLLGAGLPPAGSQAQPKSAAPVAKGATNAKAQVPSGLAGGASGGAGRSGGLGSARVLPSAQSASA